MPCLWHGKVSIPWGWLLTCLSEAYLLFILLYPVSTCHRNGRFLWHGKVFKSLICYQIKNKYTLLCFSMPCHGLPCLWITNLANMPYLYEVRHVCFASPFLFTKLRFALQVLTNLYFTLTCFAWYVRFVSLRIYLLYLPYKLLYLPYKSFTCHAIQIFDL